MNIFLTNSKTGRLADKRIRIARYDAASAPDEIMDLVFTREDIEDECGVAFSVGSGIDLTVFHTNHERLAKFYDADESKWTDENIKAIAAREKTIWEDYEGGNSFGIVCERWNAAEREWTQTDDSVTEIYGAESALDVVKDLLEAHKDENYIVTCEEDCKYDFDIVKNGCDDKNV